MCWLVTPLSCPQQKSTHSEVCMKQQNQRSKQNRVNYWKRTREEYSLWSLCKITNAGGFHQETFKKAKDFKRWRPHFKSKPHRWISGTRQKIITCITHTKYQSRPLKYTQCLYMYMYLILYFACIHNVSDTKRYHL